MIAGLILSVGSLFFLLLLFVSYFSKQRFISIKNKLYRYLLVTSFVLLVTEFASAIYFGHGNYEIVSDLLFRIYWLTRIIWFMLLYFYSLCFLDNLEYNNIFELIKDNKRCKIIFVISCIFLIVYLFIPFMDMKMETFTYIPGYAAYYILAYCALLITFIILYMMFNAKNAEKRKKVSIILMMIDMIVILGFQLVFPKVAILGLGIAIEMYFLYFYIENPDLQIIAELENVKKDIDRSNRAKSDFLSNMSHEIRTPMNAIVGFSDTILNDSNFDEKRTRGDIEHILSAGNNLLEIINNILDISKIESGSETLDNREYSPANVIMELTSIIEARIASRPIKLIVDIDKETPSRLYGDQVKVFQILLNILTNAVKYTEVGKIKLNLDSVIDKDMVTLKIKVADTGYGIKKEDYDKLFEKFSRLDSATTNEIEGTGLGLVITKKYVDLMNGKIWFESEYGVGTTFYVDIEQKIVDATPVGDIREPEKVKEKIDYIDCSKYNIMIVDDNKLNLKVAERILKSYKFNIDTFDNGKDCIYKIKEGKKYDMIFLDHMMPELDGIEVIHILKKLEDYDIPPIVALTANAITGMREMYLEEGFDEYLSKPINISELNKLIKKYFENKD